MAKTKTKKAADVRVSVECIDCGTITTVGPSEAGPLGPECSEPMCFGVVVPVAVTSKLR